MNKKNKESWVPKIGDIYYVPKNASYAKYRNTGTAWDEFMISDFEVFETREEAVECAKKMLQSIKEDI